MKTFIIAECGINHEGDLDKAKMLVDAAVRCGADAVKFQTFIPETIALDDHDLTRLRKYALAFDDFEEIKEYCDRESIEFMSTPFCQVTAEFLNEIGVQRFKISSGCVTNMALLKKVASFLKPVIISFGMSTHSECQDAIATMVGYGLSMKDITALYCRSIYPATEDNITLGNMRWLKWMKVPIGLSDHTKSTFVPALAVAAGAVVIEKHLTLWPDSPGADHAMSMDDDGFMEMVININRAEQIMQTGPQIMESEKTLKDIWSRKLAGKNAT